MSTSIEKETSNSFLEYSGNIMFVRIKEGAEITIDSMTEQYEAQKEMVRDDEYAVLVDGTKNSLVSPESRRFMAAHRPPKRKATAIVSSNNLGTLLVANFYLKLNRPKVRTKLFKHEADAVAWLKEKLNRRN